MSNPQRKYKLALTVSDETDKQIYAINAGQTYDYDNDALAANEVELSEMLERTFLTCLSLGRSPSRRPSPERFTTEGSA